MTTEMMMMGNPFRPKPVKRIEDDDTKDEPVKKKTAKKKAVKKKTAKKKG